MKTSACLLSLAALITMQVPASAQEGFPLEPEVPYVPTPDHVVEEMLKIADVGGDDVLYDLGCGDGRIIIAAARRFGTKGVGIDIDPVRIEESRRNAEEAGVADKIMFWEGDLFEADISRATVVSLFLLTAVNLRLRPRLFGETRPGTRIVSHNFSMGEWEPDKSVDVRGEYSTHTVYYWVVPANVSGT